ncbi:MAG TPA: glutamate synthase subunit beta [Planctomycetota bacterium]|nr:glutamate synthase subunit beta [Planctomycetota bacterium]HRR82630.1 glutamate synthase subunit beta [Planctomycetota bacterium]HRT96213.1 glutamate synthase subunit beta [Planctomycetota bacterium]
MGKPTGFLLYERQDPPKRPVVERVHDYQEIELRLPVPQLEVQAARCMDCGIPFCHSFGCPVQNLIPDWNDMVYRKQWRKALDLLHATNNLPEVTGRVCPAPCEAACTLSINQKPVAIKQIELQIIERGWERGWVQPEPAPVRTGKKVAIIGSGPTGLAAAQQLARRGHEVVVFEKADRPGGILRYGIPDFKLEKWVIDRRIEQMRSEGVVFETRVEAGSDVSVRYLRRTFDAILLAAGARTPRDLKIPGRELGGIHFAMRFLTQQNRRNAGDTIPPDEAISAAGKSVVVIGGGDTGADCIGTARRQGARDIVQIELLPEPPAERPPDNPWPTWPRTLRSSSSHEEGCRRLWSIGTREFVGEGRVQKLRCVRLEWSPPDASGRSSFKEVPGSDFELPADLVLLAMGFTRIEHGPLIEDLGVEVTDRGVVRVDADYRTSAEGVFAAGDSVLGASLVVRAIYLGRQAAAAMDRHLMR